MELLGALRDAESRGLEVGAVVSKLAGEGPVEAGQDPAVVLRVRLHRFERATGMRRSPRQDLVAGLVPRAINVAEEDLGKAIQEREEAIANRARCPAEQAIRAQASWTRGLGHPPVDSGRQAAWWERVSIVAAYRDRWGVGSESALGVERDVRSVSQLAHRNRAVKAAAEAAGLGGMPPKPAQCDASVATPEQRPDVSL